MKNLLIVLGIIFFLYIEIIREITTFKVTHYEIVSEKLKKNMGEKKIAFISDLHNYSYGKTTKLLKSNREKNRDIILSAGDLLVRIKTNLRKRQKNLSIFDVNFQFTVRMEIMNSA